MHAGSSIAPANALVEILMVISVSFTASVSISSPCNPYARRGAASQREQHRATTDISQIGNFDRKSVLCPLETIGSVSHYEMIRTMAIDLGGRQLQTRRDSMLYSFQATLICYWSFQRVPLPRKVPLPAALSCGKSRVPRRQLPARNTRGPMAGHSRIGIRGWRWRYPQPYTYTGALARPA